MYHFLFLLVICIFLSSCHDNDTPTNNHTNSAECRSHRTPFAYSLCSFDKATLHSDLHLYWKTDEQPLYTFEKLISHLDTQQMLTFAMNAGMYNDKFAPIGYTVIDGKEILSLNLKDGTGNFHLMPNGVFWWDDTGFYIDTSLNMAQKLRAGTRPAYATQSGPMLVIDGQIHPKFDPNSTSLKIRNGVGVDCDDGKVHFVISDTTVTFFAFADIFKNGLGCQNALFLDGGIASALYAPTLGRTDKLNMGVMLALVQDVKR